MYFFITFLRAISAIIITNSHYTEVYPEQWNLLASGGLLGDVLFFAISGYCLTNVKLSFPKWMLKRITRIYPAVILITLVYCLLGFYMFPKQFDYWVMIQDGAVSVNWEAFSYLGKFLLNHFIYPTRYHFVASIIVLYIPFYFIMKIKVLSDRLPAVILGCFGLQLFVYIFFFDKSTYGIDNVYDNMIRFLFFISMLIGAYVRKNQDKFLNRSKAINYVLTGLLLVLYFFSKLFFTKYEQFAYLQILNQVILLALLYFMFVTFAGMENRLEKLPEKLKQVTAFLSTMTLEIYLVQVVIIKQFSKILTFPLNWLVITATIILAAALLHFVSKKIIAVIEKPLKLKQ